MNVADTPDGAPEYYWQETVDRALRCLEQIASHAFARQSCNHTLVHLLQSQVTKLISLIEYLQSDYEDACLAHENALFARDCSDHELSDLLQRARSIFDAEFVARVDGRGMLRHDDLSYLALPAALAATTDHDEIEAAILQSINAIRQVSSGENATDLPVELDELERLVSDLASIVWRLRRDLYTETRRYQSERETAQWLQGSVERLRVLFIEPGQAQ